MRTFTPTSTAFCSPSWSGMLRGGERVDLLEHPRHRREEARVHLRDVGDDHLRVARPVGEHRAELERGELDQDRERVRERQEEVGRVALLERRVLHHRVRDRAVVARASARSPWAGRWCRTCRCRGRRPRARPPVARLPLGLVTAAAALAQLLERQRVAEVGALRVHHDHVLELGHLSSTSRIFASWLASSHEDGLRVRVLQHVLALRRRVGLVDRDQRAAGGEDPEARLRPLGPRVARGSTTLSPGSMPRSISPSETSLTTSPSSP